MGISDLTEKQLEKDSEVSDYLLEHTGFDRFGILAINVSKRLSFSEAELAY